MSHFYDWKSLMSSKFLRFTVIVSVVVFVKPICTLLCCEAHTPSYPPPTVPRNARTQEKANSTKPDSRISQKIFHNVVRLWMNLLNWRPLVSKIYFKVWVCFGFTSICVENDWNGKRGKLKTLISSQVMALNQPLQQ